MHSRLHLRGIRHIIFYSLPQHSYFYSELVNMVGDCVKGEMDSTNGGNAEQSSALEDDELSSLVLFTKYERLALERILGKKRSDHVFTSKKSTFMFC